MAADAAGAAAQVLVAFRRGSNALTLGARQLCGRLEEAMEAAEAAETAPGAAHDPTQVAAALRRAAGRDPEVAGLVRRLAAAAPQETDDRPRPARQIVRQNVSTTGNQNFGIVAGRDVHMGESGLSKWAETISSAAGAAREPGPAPQQPPADVVLLAAADPIDLERLRLGLEAREIREMLRSSAGQGRWTVDTWNSVRLRDLSQALLEVRPRVVHFSGHGSSEGGLCLEDESGAAHRVAPEVLADLFAAAAGSVECVVLNACYSQSQAHAISPWVPWVVGSPAPILDQAAVRFSVGFYQALGAGCTIPEAYRLGCVHLRDVAGPDHPRPVLIPRRRRRSRAPRAGQNTGEQPGGR